MRNFCYAGIGMLCFLLGCNIPNIDIDDEWRVENLRSDLAIPFGSASYTFGELIQDLDPGENFEVDEATGEIRFMYSEEVSYTFSDDLFEIQDNSESTDLNITNASGPFAFSQSINFNQTYESQEGEIIDSIFHAASSGIRITITSTSSIGLDYTLTMNSITNTNTQAPLVFTGSVSSGNDQQTSQGLNGYKTVLTEVSIGDEDLNQYDMTIDLTASLGVGEDFNNDQIAVQVEFLTQDFDILFGKLGRDTVDFVGSTIDIDFFQDFGGDGIEFGDATMTFDITSSFGIPIGLGLQDFYVEEPDGTQSFLNGSVLSNPPLIASAGLNEATLQPEAEQSIIEINSFNSTLGQLLGTSPTTVGLAIKGITNPNDNGGWNFITQDAEIDATVDLEIPLAVSFRDVAYNLDFDIEGGVDFSQVDSLEIRMITLNELPFNVTMDMYFLTSAGDTLYRALDNKALDQPFLNQDRTVREPKIAVEDIPIGEAGAEALSVTDIIRVAFTLNSPESQTSEEIFVKLLSTARIEVTLGARGIIDSNLKEFFKDL